MLVLYKYFEFNKPSIDPQVDMGGASGVMASSRLMWEINLRRKVRACRKLRIIFSISFFTLSPTNMYLMWYLSMGQGHPSKKRIYFSRKCIELNSYS